MAEVALNAGSVVSKWVSKYFREYVRASRFLPYMGDGESKIFTVKYELQTEAGKTINIPLVTRLTGNGVGGSEVLDGNEEELGNYNCSLSVDWVRNGIRVPKSETYKTEIDLLNAARAMLKQWSAEDLRTDIIHGLMQVIGATDNSGTTIPYAEITLDTTNGGYMVASTFTAGATFLRRKGVTWTSATEANKDAWLAANTDRVLFGATRSNASSNDHSTSLANVDSTSDRLTCATASLAKRMAQNANPHITPYMTEDGREYFVMFCAPRSFRDLKGDSVMIAANRDTRSREGAGMDKNPLFQDGDLIYDGIIFREVPEIPHLVNVGASGTTDVEPNFLCGQQAMGIAWGQEPTPKTDSLKDYGFRPGVAMEELRTVKKLAYNGKQNGIVTVYCAAPADS